MRWPPSHNTAVAITTRPLLAVAAVVVVVAVMVELARVNLRQISKCSPPVTGLLPPPWKVFPLFLNINPRSLFVFLLDFLTITATGYWPTSPSMEGLCLPP